MIASMINFGIILPGHYLSPGPLKCRFFSCAPFGSGEREGQGTPLKPRQGRLPLDPAGKHLYVKGPPDRVPLWNDTCLHCLRCLRCLHWDTCLRCLRVQKTYPGAAEMGLALPPGRPQGSPLPYTNGTPNRLGYAKRLRPTCRGHVSNAGLAPALIAVALLAPRCEEFRASWV